MAYKPKNMAERKYEKVYTSNPLDDASPEFKVMIGQMENYIMKNCLWQFNSRGWDRRKQNAGVLGITSQLLCNEAVELSSPQQRCYWVDAVCLERTFKASFPWITALDKADLKSLMALLHARIDWLTIDGSLNAELTVVNY